MQEAGAAEGRKWIVIGEHSHCEAAAGKAALLASIEGHSSAPVAFHRRDYFCLGIYVDSHAYAIRCDMKSTCVQVGCFQLQAGRGRGNSAIETTQTGSGCE